MELQGAGIRRGYVRGSSRAAGGVLEGKIRLLQPLTGQGAGAHDAGLQGLLLAAVALSHEAPRRARGRIAGTVPMAFEAPPASLVHDEAASSCAVVCGFAV